MRPTSQHTRRNVLRLLATTGVASSIPFMVEPALAGRAEDERLQAVCGSVTEAGGRSLRLTDTNGQEVLVRAREGARLHPGLSGAMANTDGFLVGDRVVAQGSWCRGGSAAPASPVQAEGGKLPPSEEYFDAMAVGSVFRRADVLVRSFDAAEGTLDTESGSMKLVGRAASAARPGGRLTGLVWDHPTTGDRYFAIGRPGVTGPARGSGR